MLDGPRDDVGVDTRPALQRDRLETLDPLRVELVPSVEIPACMTSACAAPFVQIAVLTLAGSTIETPIPHGASSTRSESAIASSACFDAAYWTEKRERAPPSDRAHQHNASLRAPKQWKERLQHGDLPDDVHLELAAKLVERNELERRCDRDAGVVDEAVQFAANDLGSGRDRREVRDVELEWLDAMLAQPLGVLLAADATEDAPAGGGKPESRSLPDPRRRSRDENRASHVLVGEPFRSQLGDRLVGLLELLETHPLEHTRALRELNRPIVDDLPVIPPWIEEVVIADHPRACVTGTTYDLGLVVDDEPVVPCRDRVGGALEREELVAHVDEGHRTTPPSKLESVDDAARGTRSSRRGRRPGRRRG